MKQKFLLLFLCLFATIPISARQADQDSTKQHLIEQIVIRSSAKETNNLWRLPSATTLITPTQIAARGIESIKDISGLVPNLYIPDYGSRMTTPIYLRGVGTRSSGQSVGVYVDNIPYMDKSTFDFELMDIQRLEVLRGPQGTLYGRNAMGGIVNIYTLSALDYQGTKISLGAGNYNSYNVKASHYAKFSDQIGISIGGYYDRTGGYFTNHFDGSKADKAQSAGGRLKLDWLITPRLTASLASSFDFNDQGAFPYGLYHKETGITDPVNYNDKGTYTRRMTNNSLRFEYQTDKVLFTSNTGYQYLNDNMWMDQDFTAASIFTINQRQRQHSVNQEFSVRSTNSSNYQWSVGAFGFYNALSTIGDVTFKEDGIKTILQPVFDGISAGNPKAPSIKITDSTIPNPGDYNTPSQGVAVFHQSTFNNLLTRGLSLTLGLRFDYEQQSLDYNTMMAFNTMVTMPAMPPRPPISMPVKVDTTMKGSTSQDFFQILPKISLKYECTPEIMTYFTASKGHKAGGYNIQMFSEVIQKALMAKFNPNGSKVDMKSMLSYRPEVTWNYELGARVELLDGVLTGDLALFYMDIRDVQLTQFVDGGSGRILSNAGRGKSLGAELSARVRLAKGLFADLNYGYTHATFTEYNDGKSDYKGKFIPYTPQHTFSLGASYWLMINNSFIDQLSFSAAYNGCGQIYWTEANDIQQPFYGVINAKAAVRCGAVKLELWGCNILNTNYGAFYFESFDNSFIQKGRPVTFGANLSFNF